MPQWTIATKETQEIAVLLAPRFSNLCLANAVEPLRAANELLGRQAYRWRFVTLDGAPVQSSSGLPVLPDGPLRDHPGGESLFVIASHDAAAVAGPVMRRALSAADGRFGGIVGMDTGSWLLADAGLLDGRVATIHPAELIGFAERFQEVSAVADRHVTDGRVATCGGAMSTFDLVLDRLRRAHGEALKLDLSRYFVEHPTRPEARVLDRAALSPALARCLDEMAQSIEAPLQIGALAATLGISARSLSRLFHAELDASPSMVYRRLRLNAARDYARHSRYTVAEIAVRCGYRDASAMTRAFRRAFGCPPTAFRTGTA